MVLPSCLHHNNILMTDLHLSSGLTNLFSQRLRQYLLFLEVTKDHELMHLFLSFLDLNDLLHFLVTSSHFYELRKTQSVQVRLLRAKIAYYERPKTAIGYDPFMFFLNVKIPEPPEKNVQKMREKHQSLLNLNRQIRLFQNQKKEGKLEGKEIMHKGFERKGKAEYSQISEELYREGKQLEMALMKPELKQQGWSKVAENQIQFFQQKKEEFEKKNIGKGTNSLKVVQYNQKTSRLAAMEYLWAKKDHERRRQAKKIKTKEELEFIPLEEFKRLAERDACSLQVYNRVYQDQKAKQQRENVSKLRMPPPPSIPQKILQLPPQPEEPKPTKQSIAGKMISGIKSLLFI